MQIPYRMRIEQRKAITSAICANLPAQFAGEEIVFFNPEGLPQVVLAGTKPEYGPAGLELLTYDQFAPAPNFYIIMVGSVVFTFDHPYGSTLLVIEDVEPIPPCEARGMLHWHDTALSLEDIEIVALDGTLRDLGWLETNYGTHLCRTDIPDGVTQVARIVKLIEREGPAVQIVNVIDVDGIGMEGVPVVRYWPDAPHLPNYDPPTSRWFERGVYGPTNMYGDIGFGMGGGDYAGPGEGVSAVWTTKPGIPSDLANKLMMLPLTQHRCLQVNFQIAAVEDEEEEDCALLTVVKEIRDILEGGYISIPRPPE